MKYVYLNIFLPEFVLSVCSKNRGMLKDIIKPEI